MAEQKSPEYDENGVLKQRIKNTRKLPAVEFNPERVKAGPSGSPAALPGDPEVPQQAQTKKSASPKKK